MTGCLRYARACLPHLEARRGSMIHIASDAGVIGEDPIGAYSVSKAAVVMLGKMLAVDCGRRGVRSNVLCPGDISPGMREMLAPGESRRADDPGRGRCRRSAGSARRRTSPRPPSFWRRTTPRS